MTESPTTDRAPSQGGARLLFIAAAAVIVCAGLKSAQDIVVQFLLAVFLALICLPAMHGLARIGVPAAFRVLGVLIGLAVIMFGMAAIVGTEVQDFDQARAGYQARLTDWWLNSKEQLKEHGLELPFDQEPAPPRNAEPDAAVGAAPGAAPGATSGAAGSSTQVVANSKPNDTSKPTSGKLGGLSVTTVFAYASSAFATLGGLASNAMVIFLLLVFLLAESAGFPAKVRAATHGQGQVQARLDEVASRINRYFAIKTAVSALTGITAGVGLSLMGVDFPILWGLVAFLLNFVPNIGSIIAAMPPTLIALVQPEGFWQLAVGVLVLYVAINLIYGNLVEPKWLGKGLDLSTFVVFASLVFWGWLLGPVGMLLSTPLTAALRIAMEAFDDTRSIAVLLGAGVDPPVDAEPNAG
tara:strand:- start:1794 stop:3026 length:1233 start_codon:yes stop_codon:yes gene_type:complete